MNKTVYIIIAVVAVLAGGVWWSNSLQDNDGSGSPIVSRSGIHWHPQLEIFVKGERQEITPNIGLLGRHASMHTHDASGELHLESDGIIREDDVKLGRFFDIWGKEFNSECVFEYCGSEEEEGGHMMMFVNGEENFEFGDYMMRDGDKIEIRYE